MSGERAESIGRLVVAARKRSGSLESRHLAFSRLVERSQHIVLAAALARLQDLEDARDAAQESFATAWHRLHQLRDPVAFPAWLNAIVRSECARRQRRQVAAADPTAPSIVEADTRRLDYRSVVLAALDRLPLGERHAIVLYYFLGYGVADIARLLSVKRSTVAKRLHSARLRVRRELPRGVRGDFVPLVPPADFVRRVRLGLLDEYVGDYRFDRRPDHVVRIVRDGDSLIGEAGGQRHLLVPGGTRAFVTRHYDGEGRFSRNSRGEVTHFVYYEFGRRLGIARKVRSGAGPAGSAE